MFITRLREGYTGGSFERVRSGVEQPGSSPGS